MSVISELIDSIIAMPGEFADVATQGPVEGLLVLIGALFVIVPSVALGYLTLGVVVDLLLPDSSEISHP
jgi:hypothetical protein